MSAGLNPQESVATLRLPVPFFDLLMVLLVTCLVFVAPVRPDEDIRAIDLPVAQGGSAGSASALMPVKPHRAGEGWNFQIVGEGNVIAPAALAQRAAAENRKVILVVPPATPLQDFIAMQSVLTQLKVPFALAVQHKEFSAVIRTAILAAMLLVMLSMAYSRTAQLPDLRVAQEPAKAEPQAEPEVATLAEPIAAPPSPRTKITVRPGIDPASPMTPVRPTIAKTAARAVAPPPPPAQLAEVAEPEAPLAPATVPQVAPVAAPQPAPAVHEAPLAPAPVIAKAAPIPAEPALPKVADAPAEPTVANVTALEDMPVTQVATPRVMMPRDLPLPSEAPVTSKFGSRAMAANDIMDDGFPAPPPGSNVTPAPKDVAAKKPAEAPQFMSREERTRELYRLAREMEDTFISKLTH